MSKNSSIKEVLFSSMKMATGTFSSRILGLVREQVTAAMFGASGFTDAFILAQRIPNMLRDLFAEGAFSAAFVPVFTEVLHKDEQEAKRLLWSLFVVLGAVTGVISLIIIIFAPELVALVAPKFAGRPEQFEVAVVMTRIMAPFLVLISLAALFMGVLNSLRVFFVPALAPAFYNVVMIASIIFVSRFLSARGINPIFSLAIGVVFGGLTQMLVQLPLIFRKAFGPTGPIKLISDHTKKVANRVSIGTIGIAATQVNIIVTTKIATDTIIGAVSWLQYGFRLFQFPVGLFAVSIAGSNLVHFSRAWKGGDSKRAIEVLQSSYRLALFTLVPALVVLFALSLPCVNLIFERGEFDSQDSMMTAMALRYYLLGLPFYGLYKIFSPTFYSLDKPKIPVTISVIAIALNLIFCLTLTPIYGFKILAMGTSLSMLIIILVQSFFLKKLLNLSLWFFFKGWTLKILIASTAAYFATSWLAQRYYLSNEALLLKLLTFVLIAFGGGMAYLVTLILLGEYKIIRRIFAKKSL